MDKEPKTNAENENLRDLSKGDGDTIRKQEFHRTDYTGSDSLNDDRPDTGDDEGAQDLSANEDGNDDTNKYLAMEQPGVSYTGDSEPANLSDDLSYSDSDSSDKWEAGAGNGTYSDAFNQDDYILTDNVDLDEDQNQSISSDDEDFEETNERYTS
jgi:hypothetical protein